jgi:hypothetical protein
MAVAYTWKLVSLKKTNAANLSNVVVGTRWDCTGTDEEGNSGVFNGATKFSPTAIDPNNFVDWNNLTEETVLSWIQDVLNRGGMDHVQAQIQKQIDTKKNVIEEVSANSFPWISE